MGDMLVAYEDDVPKDRGLKVSGHCALDSGLGCANTFAPYCIYIYIYPTYKNHSPKANLAEACLSIGSYKSDAEKKVGFVLFNSSPLASRCAYYVLFTYL